MHGVKVLLLCVCGMCMCKMWVWSVCDVCGVSRYTYDMCSKVIVCVVHGECSECGCCVTYVWCVCVISLVWYMCGVWMYLGCFCGICLEWLWEQ